MNFRIYPERIVKILTLIALLLCVASLTGQFDRYVLGFENSKLIVLFNVDAEGNIPSLYAGFQLLLSSLILSAIAIVNRRTKGSYVKHWYGLSIVFLYMAFDEWFAIHERLNPALNNFFQIAPLVRLDILSLVFVTIFVVVYLKFLLSLSPRTKLLFILSGSLYVFGAIAIEIMGLYLFFDIYKQPRFSAQIISTIEEFLEMLGLNLFIYATLLHFANLPIRKLSFEIIDNSLPIKKTLEVSHYR
ncbi:MAG: hypothetical protein MUD14_06870 [Hydrococcus sp. Prado102]|jgi:hypothetical protein|nr:hypothetical protein [Hydrococcus sp. Prado102]